MPFILNKPEIQKEFNSFHDIDSNKKLYSSLCDSETLRLNNQSFPSYIRPIRILDRFNISGPHFELALLDDPDSTVAYYIRVITRTDIKIKNKCPIQLLSWSSSLPKYKDVLSYLTHFLIESYLLRHYNVVVSDINLLIEGNDYWQSKMLEAINNNYNIYKHDAIIDSNTLITLNNIISIPNQIQQLCDWLSDSDISPDNQDRVAVISKRKL